MSSEKRSISAPANLYAQADRRKEQLGYSTFSDYIQALLRADALGGGDHLREAAARPVPDSPSTPAVPSAQTDTSYHKRRKRRK